MMPPADRIREQNEQDPGRVAHTRQVSNKLLSLDMTWQKRPERQMDI